MGGLEHIILDLDKTLVFSIIDEENDRIKAIRIRPYLKHFLDFLFRTFETVNIWSAGSSKYVAAVTDHLRMMLPIGYDFGFVFDDMKCCFETDTSNHPPIICVKKLKDQVFDRFESMSEKNTIIIDDTPLTFCYNRDNAIAVIPFDGNLMDRGLIKIAEKLYNIKRHKLRFQSWKNRIIKWNEAPSEEFLQIWQKEKK